MSRPIVAITQRVDSFPDRDELRDAVDQKLLNWIFEAGFLPVTLPNIYFSNDKAGPAGQSRGLELAIAAICPVALLLSGGNDIGEFPARDATEGFLLEWAQTRRIPVLGICRGLQMMAVAAGTALVPLEGHVGIRHNLNFARLEENRPGGVNSFHNWGLAGCPDGYQVTATAEDGSIEAIRHTDLPWEGWMWHPERETPLAEADTRNLQRLFNDAP